MIGTAIAKARPPGHSGRPEEDHRHAPPALRPATARGLSRPPTWPTRVAANSPAWPDTESANMRTSSNAGVW
jgi:hypothetical protein